MKFSSTLPTLATLLAATLVEAAPQNRGVARQRGNNGAQLKQFGSNGGAQSFRNKNGQNGGNNANNNNGGNNNANNANNGGGNNNNAAGNSDAEDLQSSLTLSPDQVQPGLAQDGQAVPVDGQVASLTSTNNFINHCATLPNLPLTNGQQVLTGSCNPTIMGEIIAKDKMPSGKIINPPNFGTVAAGQSIEFKIAVKNMNTGNFVNANQNYFAAPQQADGSGILLAHSHITVNKISSFQDNEPCDPTVFAFFKGLNDPAVNGILSADADGGLDPGFYRACTINTAANHQPALVAVAQHASLDDCTYFQVTEDGQADDNNNGDADDAAATTTADAAAATGNAGNNNNGQNGNNNAQNGNNNGQNGNNNGQNGNNNGQNGNNNAQNGNNGQNGGNNAQNGNNGGNRGKNNNAGANRGGNNAAAAKGKNAGANQGNNAAAAKGNNAAANKGNNNAAAAKGNNAAAAKGNNAAAAKNAAGQRNQGNNAAAAQRNQGNNAAAAQRQGNRLQAAAGANKGQKNGNRRPFPFAGRRPNA